MSYPHYPQQPGQYPSGEYLGGQYPRYQNAPPPLGYGVGGMPPPSPGWAGQTPEQLQRRPPPVTYAIYALIANMVIGLINSALVFANKDAYIAQALAKTGLDPSSAAAVSAFSDIAFTVGAIFGLFFVALWAMFVWFAWKGHNWARVVIWVFGGLALISAFAAFGSPLGTVVALTVVSLLLTLTAVVLLALKPSNDWYRFQGEARKYGWPGRA